MKIALATNNRKTIAKRTGRANEFAVYHIEDGKTQSIDYKKNTHEHHNHDRKEGNHRRAKGKGYGIAHEFHQNHIHKHHSHGEVVKQLKDIDMLLVRAVGKHMKKDLTEANIPFQLVKTENIEETIAAYLKNI